MSVGARGLTAVFPVVKPVFWVFTTVAVFEVYGIPGVLSAGAVQGEG